MKSQIIPYKGKQILVCAYNDFGANLVGLTAEVHAVDTWSLTQPLNSVLSVTDVSRTTPTPPGEVPDDEEFRQYQELHPQAGSHRAGE